MDLLGSPKCLCYSTYIEGSFNLYNMHDWWSILVFILLRGLICPWNKPRLLDLHISFNFGEYSEMLLNAISFLHAVFLCHLQINSAFSVI